MDELPVKLIKPLKVGYYVVYEDDSPNEPNPPRAMFRHMHEAEAFKKLRCPKGVIDEFALVIRF